MSDSERIMGGDDGRATAEYVARRLRDLGEEADTVITAASALVDAAPEDRYELYREAWWDLHMRLGHGSLGPATAAVAPLLGEKQTALATRLGIADAVREEFVMSCGRTLPNLGRLGCDIELCSAPVFLGESNRDEALRDVVSRLDDCGEVTVEPLRRFSPSHSGASFAAAVRALAAELHPAVEVIATARHRFVLVRDVRGYSGSCFR